VTPGNLLGRHPLFQALTPGEIVELAGRARIRSFAARQVVFERDDPGDGMYGVLAGSVAIIAHSAAGKELVINMFGPGEFFGEIALLDAKGRTNTAVARAQSDLLFVSRRAFLPFLERPALAARVIALLCDRLRRTTQLVEDTQFLNVAARLAKGLLGMAEHTGHRVDNGIAIAISQAELAQTLGVSREIVSRQLLGWRDAGLVALGRNRIVLRDVKALADAVTGG